MSISASGLLLDWYDTVKRDLPWRRTKDPYCIWLSEIMLQQTRVETVKGYYARFLEWFPTVEALAAAPQEKVLKAWEGLGYYSRARNLQKAARTVVEEHGGQMPASYEALRRLSGIGDYTAGAIASIAFGIRAPAVDGNVLRVLARLRADEEAIDLPQVKKRVREELAAVYPTDCPGEFTQALMELGATVCVPNGEPKCDFCPCREICQGRESWQMLPVKLPKRAKKQEDRTVFILRCGDRYAIEKRPSRGLLADLWQFPNVVGHLSAAGAVAWAEERGLHPRNVEKSIDRNHIFTHIRWDLRGWFLEVDSMAGGYTWLTLEEIDTQAALPTAFRQFREEI